MQSQDLEVLSALRDWLEAGRTAYLCTIVETYGSSPRPAGSLLALSELGETVGSLSGGCVEDDLIDGLSGGGISVDQPILMEYGVASEDVERLGLPCGGTLSIMVERFGANASDTEHVQGVLTALQSRQAVTRHVFEGVSEQRRLEHASKRPGITFSGSKAGPGEMQHTLGPKLHLFLIGAGMVSQYLAEMAMRLDYEVTVCDPRENIRDQWRVAGARCIGGMPDDAILAHASDADSAIVALTHDPRIDDMGLLEALETEAFYIGAMGSRKSSEARRGRLSALGLTDTQIGKLRAPVGLPIGSKTPAEIAVAILADLISVSRTAFASSPKTASGSYTNPAIPTAL